MNGLYLRFQDGAYIRIHDGNRKDWEESFPGLEERRQIGTARWEWWQLGCMVSDQPMDAQMGYSIPVCGKSLAGTPLLYFKC